VGVIILLLFIRRLLRRTPAQNIKRTFAGKRVLVTGAGGGLGKAYSLHLAKVEAQLILTDIRPDILEEVASLCKEAGARGVTVVADLSKREECKKVMEAAAWAFGGKSIGQQKYANRELDGMVLNAGLAQTGPFAEADLETFQKVIDVNFMSYVNLMSFGLPYLRQAAVANKTPSRVLVMSSLSAKTVLPESSAYCASKYALQGFFKSLLGELPRSEITCTLCCPGFIPTPIYRNSLDSKGVRLGDRYLLGDKPPTDRLSLPSAEMATELLLEATALGQHEIIIPFSGKIVSWITFLAPTWMAASAAADRIKNQARTRKQQ